MHEQQLAVQPALIIVVDDDKAVRDSLEFSLGIEGFTVRAYSSARELLEENRLPACHCLIIDQNMPEMSGISLILMLRAREITTPAILITTNPGAVLRERAAAAGLSIVEKPLLGPALVERIHQLVADRKPAPAHEQ
jgi:FixJ family two-component response regulator